MTERAEATGRERDEARESALWEAAGVIQRRLQERRLGDLGKNDFGRGRDEGLEEAERLICAIVPSAMGVFERLTAENTSLARANYDYCTAITAAEARVAELEDALRPFASELDRAPWRAPDDCFWGPSGSELSVGHLRRAARLLSPPKDAPGETTGAR